MQLISFKTMVFKHWYTIPSFGGTVIQFSIIENFRKILVEGKYFEYYIFIPKLPSYSL